jgi:hypothetical protein
MRTFQLSPTVANTFAVEEMSSTSSFSYF